MKSKIFLVFSLFSAMGFSFPEMVRHGYMNCNTCHVSPTGGGVLTAYGRSLSQEVLSTWARDGESNFLWGAVKPPDWLSMGGDVRMVQTYLNTPTVRTGSFILMQADAEAAATYKKFQVDASIGRSDFSNPQNANEWLTSHQHYVTYHYDDQTSFRVGKFDKAFGINDPDHTISTKKGLGWDENTATYNVEAAWLGEKYDAFITGDFGRPDSPDLDREKGIALRSSMNLADAYKVGLSYFYGSNSEGNRHVFGPYGILGFTPHFFLLAEIDLQKDYPNASVNTWGWVNYFRLDYEFIRGMHVFLTEEVTKLNWNDDTTLENAYGVGVQFFPRPHFEVMATIQEQKVAATDPNHYNDFAWVMLHFYP